MAALAAVFLIGLLGSAHCVGMCGGFIVLLSLGDRREALGRQAAYFLGKTAGYTALGALAGAAGGLIGDALQQLSGALGLVLGVVLALTGLAVCGVAWGGAPWASRIATRLAPAIGTLVGSQRRGALVGLGLLNGLLPCGLVYAMLARAASTGSAGSGALTLAVFGLATIPALAFTGLLGVRLQPARRLAFQRVAGVLVIAMGLLTVARGTAALSAGQAAHPNAALEHCAPPDASTERTGDGEGEDGQRGEDPEPEHQQDHAQRLPF